MVVSYQSFFYSLRKRENTYQKNSKYGHFSRSVMQRCIQDPWRYLRWRALQQWLNKLLAIVAKSPILDVWKTPQYNSAAEIMVLLL